MVVAEVSPLERQQLEVTQRDAMTYWHRVRFELVARRAAVVGAMQILDIGAGSGLLGIWLREHRPAVGYTFTESSIVLRDRLVECFGATAEAATDQPITSESLVALLDVVEHVADDIGLLADLHDRMEPGSHLLVTAPAMQWAFSSWDEQLGHHRRYTRRTLGELCRLVGFGEVRVAYLFPELLPLLVARRVRRAPRAQVDFPQLHSVVSAAGHGVASVTTATRRLWPFGTSVVATATRTR